MKLFRYEAEKILIKQYGIFLFAAVILIRLISLPNQLEANYGFNTSADKNAYLELLKPFSGMLTEEKEEKIIGMKKRLLEAQDIKARCLEALGSGDLEAYEEMHKSLDEYTDVLKDESAIERIFEQYDYVSEEREVRALIPVKRVGVMENASVNYLFLLCICFCCAYAVMIEQSGRAEVIIRTTPNGQGKTMAAKLAVLLITITLSSIALSVIDLAALSAQLPSEYWRYNIHSLEGFKNCPVQIRIMGVFVTVQCMRLTGALFIGSAAMLAAHFSHSYAASIFPFAAVPIVADYVSKHDSQSYFFPTGLLKGWGYFYGDVADSHNEEYIVFHGVPTGYTLALTALSLLLVIGVAIILIHSGKNRLARKGKKPIKTAAFGILLALLLSSCSANGSDVIEECGGSVSVYPTYIAQNSGYKFTVESQSYIDEHGGESNTDTLNITDKETGETVEYPFDPFKGQMLIDNLFACEDCLLFACNDAIMRLNLDDFSLNVVYERKGTGRKVFGLIYDEDEADEIIFDPEGAFTDGKTVFVYDWYSGIAKVGFDGSLNFLVSDDISGGLEYDGKAFYYISNDNLLHKYDIGSDKNTVIYEGEVIPYSLKADREKIYFKSCGKEVILNKGVIC